MYYYNFLLNNYKNQRSGIMFTRRKGLIYAVFVIQLKYTNVHL
jgi:hypothetical protein